MALAPTEPNDDPVPGGAARHYERLLADLYVWMAGGLEAALATGGADVAAYLPGRGLAIDLGAGFGMHAIPLARGGFDVLALDTSPVLLDVLRAHAAGLAVRAVEADLRAVRQFAEAPAALIVCLGDTLTHLASPTDVTRLVADAVALLAPDGRFVATFRDYTRPLRGDARFVPVRSDDQRIHTCFLEEAGEHLRVHDLVHERTNGGWRQRVSSYLKLRLAPEQALAAARAAGLDATLRPGPRGMVLLDGAQR